MRTGGPAPLLDQDMSKSSKAPRLPRWTRQEILVLIEGKRVAESRGGRGQAEPKWARVSSYCRRHGVERGAVQCRKRWSNLAADYKKIKDWESSRSGSGSGSGSGSESESFWGMRNDVRRDKRLPGFFHRELYAILESHSQSSAAAAAAAMALEEDDDETVFFDSGRIAAAQEGMFSDSEQEEDTTNTPPDIPAPLPISEQQFQPFAKGPSSDGTAFGKQKEGFNPEVGNTSREGHKRKRSSRNTLLQHKLIQVLENNGKMLSDHLQSQNTNSQLDREQRKEHVDSLVAVLGKLADAFGRIADKL